MSGIDVKEVCKTFRSGRGAVKAIQDVSLTVEEGTNLVIVGRSGSGKTTLLNCLGGLERIDRGSIVCNDIDISRLSGRPLALFQRRHVGFVFQFGNLISYLTVAENIGFPLVLNGIAGRKKARRIEELLERVGLPGTGRALPHELSGGEIQRVAFARAVAHGPRLLLADEPTASLDSATGRDVINLMFTMTALQRCTTIVATHDPDVIASAANRLVLKDGRIENSASG